MRIMGVRCGLLTEILEGLFSRRLGGRSEGEHARAEFRHSRVLLPRDQRAPAVTKQGRGETERGKRRRREERGEEGARGWCKSTCKGSRSRGREGCFGSAPRGLLLGQARRGLGGLRGLERHAPRVVACGYRPHRRGQADLPRTNRPLPKVRRKSGSV